MTHPADLRAGTQLPAGLGVATVLPDIDFESYSEAGSVFDYETQKWVGPPGAAKGKKGLFVVGAAPLRRRGHEIAYRANDRCPMGEVRTPRGRGMAAKENRRNKGKIMIQVKTASLKAACVIAATKDVRYYLVGVQILVRGDGTVHIRATNGASAFDDISTEKSLLAGANFIIPLAVAKDLAKEKARMLEFSLQDDGKWVCAGRIFAPLDGEFPDCDRAWPARDPAKDAEIAHYDMELLADAQKAMRFAKENTRAFFRMQHGNTGLMYCEDSTWPRVAVMPLRDVAFSNQ